MPSLNPGKKKLSTFLPLPVTATVKTSNVESVPFEQVADGTAAYPLSTFENFLRKEQAIENLDFYRSVKSFKEKYSVLSQNDAGESYSVIVNTFILPGSEQEVNISGSMRQTLLDAYAEKKFNEHVLDDAQKEIYGVMYSDKYPRFLNQLKTTNLNDDMASQATMLGVKLLLVSFLIFGVFIGLQVFAQRELESRSDVTLEILDHRLWRLLGFTFLFQGISFIITGKMRLCGICAAAGNNYSTYTGETGNYTKMIVKEFIGNRCGKSTQTEDENSCKLCVIDIETENKKLAKKIALYALLLSVVIMIGVLFVPPNNPKWY